jgi:hypothetical protein
VSGLCAGEKGSKKPSAGAWHGSTLFSPHTPLHSLHSSPPTPTPIPRPYNFSKPLPKFDDRQAAFADSKKLEYEERLDRWGGGASDEGTSFKTKPFPFSKPLEPFFERQESQRAKSDEEGKKRRKEAEEKMAKKH